MNSAPTFQSRKSRLFLMLLISLLLTAFVSDLVIADELSFARSKEWGTAQDDTRSVAVGDMDQDGDLDLIVGNLFQKITVYFNDGSGSFGSTSTFGTELDATKSIAVGDINGDGSLDIVTGNLDQKNKVYINNGNGNFDTSIAFGAINNTDKIVLGDLDGDNDYDIVEGVSGQQNNIYLNNFANNPALPLAEVRPIGGDNTGGSILIADLNQDQHLDIVGNAGSQNAVYLNDGLGSFSEFLFGNSDSHLAAGDIDNDDDVDVISGKTIYVNNGLGQSFTARPYSLWKSLDIDLGDIDNDSDLDIVLSIDPSFTIGIPPNPVIFLNNGSGQFGQQIQFGTGGQFTYSIALADMNSDRGLDIIVGNGSALVPTDNVPLQNFIYFNSNINMFVESRPFGQAGDGARHLLSGDIDGINGLDLIVGVAGFGQNIAYTNDGSGNFTDTKLFGALSDTVSDIAIGDMNSDGDLDILISNQCQIMPGQTGLIYLNDGSANFSDSIPFGSPPSCQDELFVGDFDGDIDLDIIATDTIYFNNGIAKFDDSFTLFASEKNEVIIKAIGDLDDDGDLDIIVSIAGVGNTSYINDGRARFTRSQMKYGSIAEFNSSMAIANVDGVNGLDIIVANDSGIPHSIYFNDGTGVFDTSRQFGTTSGTESSLTVGDMDGDADIDVIIGESNQPLIVYLNDGAGHFGTSIEFGTFNFSVPAISVGQFDGSKGLDVVTLSESSVALDLYSTGFSGATIRAEHPGRTPSVDYYSTAEVIDTRYIPIPYVLSELNSKPFGNVLGCYSENGEGNWKVAIPSAAQTIEPLEVEYPNGGCPFTKNPAILPTSPQRTDNIFFWDTFANGFYGQSDNVLFRLEAVPYLGPITSTVPGPFQYPRISATTHPFRVRGIQVQVLDEKGIPDADAVVYRLPSNENLGGKLYGRGSNPVREDAFRTNGQGYLQGRGEIREGDRLLALAPAPDKWWEGSKNKMPWMRHNITETSLLKNKIHLYYTNGTPTEVGVSTTISNAISGTVDTKVTGPGVQVLTVSEDNPLFLFDLQVALEWDANEDTRYLDQLEADLLRASDYIYNYTNGQAALGHITVTMSAEDWTYADVLIQASNRMRPYAAQGGVVTTPFTDTEQSGVVYEPGQVRMGATWNRYGEPGEELDDDWPLALAHELSHYLFFQEDAYLGVDENDFLIPVDGCTGTIMGDMYDPSGRNRELLESTQWIGGCEQTLAHRTLERAEWQTTKLFYPQMITETVPLAGPQKIPYNLTEVKITEPLTPTNVLNERTIYIDYQSGSRSSGARAYLFKESIVEPESNPFLLDLGSPALGQNELRLRGATEGDRLCVLDPTLGEFGCQAVSSTVERLSLRQDAEWHPEILVSPISSTTLAITVTHTPSRQLKLSVFQELTPGSSNILLEDPDGDGQYSIEYTAMGKNDEGLSIRVPIWTGHIVVEDPTDPSLMAVTDFRIGGNPGKGPAKRWGGPAKRWGGPAKRWGGPAKRWGGPMQRNSNAPVVSADGQMIFFTLNPTAFGDGELYVIQSTSGLPALANDPNKSAVGLGYRIIPSPGWAGDVKGSVSFQYLGTDVLEAGIVDEAEAELQIHYYDESSGAWQGIETTINTEFNLASAHSRGAGLYALLAGKSQPQITSILPLWMHSDVANNLTISGSDFVAPIEVILRDTSGITVSINATLDSSGTVSVQLPPEQLQPGEYEILLKNGDNAESFASDTLTILRGLQPNECFFDDFEQATGQWRTPGEVLEGEWSIVRLPVENDHGGHAMTDSPLGNYRSAPPKTALYTTTITSRPIDLSTCPNPVLSFAHDYVLANIENVTKDRARVDVYNGSTSQWQTVGEFSGGGVYGAQSAPLVSEEWSEAEFITQTFGLDTITGTTRLRLLLITDQDVADKGWLIDDISIVAAMVVQPTSTPMPIETPNPTFTTTPIPPTNTPTPIPVSTPTPTKTPSSPADGNLTPTPDHHLYLPFVTR